MFKKIILLGTLLVLAALSATACQAIPNLAPQPMPTTAPTVAPAATSAPAAPPQAQTKPQLPDRGKIEGALRLAAFLLSLESSQYILQPRASPVPNCRCCCTLQRRIRLS